MARMYDFHRNVKRKRALSNCRARTDADILAKNVPHDLRKAVDHKHVICLQSQAICQKYAW